MKDKEYDGHEDLDEEEIEEQERLCVLRDQFGY